MGLNKQVTFSIAKLLKEKGYNEICVNCYAEERIVNKETGGDLFTGVYRLCVRSRFHKRYYSAPTIAEVVMWLYEKHGIWVRITPIPYSDNLTHWRWEHMSTNYSTRNLKWKKEQDYMSPTEAYEAAITHVLTNLI